MHCLPNFAVLEGKSRHKHQTTTISHVRVRHPWETFSFTSFNSSVSTSCKSPDLHFFWTTKIFPKFLLNLKQAFKVKNLVPDYAPLSLSLVMCSLSSLSANTHAKQDRCWLFITLSFLWFSSVVVDKFTASLIFEVLSGLKKMVWLMVMKMCGLCLITTFFWPPAKAVWLSCFFIFYFF